MSTATLFVVDASARRAQIKVTPSRLLQDVLVEACRSKKLDPSGYILKTANNKPVDLSQPFRLSGLSAGAKLQLVQASRSPAVVNIALQLPESEGVGGRLQDKFPSSTTLWLILRKFEDGVAGASQKLNLTQRGVPSSESGAGRLMYEVPCVSAENRESEGFRELQKTLAQLGYNGGNVLLRVSFRRSEVPLEEAMKEISTFFAGAEGAQAEGAIGTIPNGGLEEKVAAPVGDEEGMEMNEDASPEPVSTAPAVEDDTLATSSETQAEPQSHAQTEDIIPTPEPALSNKTNRISVYRPSSSATPAAALQPDDPSQFEPTLDHARLHQASLGLRGQNQRLKSDKELEELETTRQSQLASVQNVRVRVQYPDEHTIETTISASATAAELYETVRSTLRGPTEPFELRFLGPKGRLESIPDLASARLVRDLGFRGGVKITLVSSAAQATPDARRNLGLREEFVRQAQELKVDLAVQQAEGEAAHREAMGKEGKKEEGGGGKGKGRGDVEAKMKKFLGFGKK
ncbi:hypothetical protein LTR91_023554 [Friedmanniomyces endolithicus]|uniref:TUG ubiquitin-like domain-containing protein n=1 Tax=Friedmanniomyces endolithicus TaxID=329885 RepID=A0A4U0UU20_9PEZI|nr:hypothetical protein LTS09_003831 [Friedmanniomyces endolithicus]KAK0271475.1 hypothetical protein LTR35_013513 [Friedmanniomyces endolithicus]KAK0280599.1 hypothetical protein LTS00_013028 [Friedmanniomyces endolithicus]KAK0315702.1 hypothetical protein LTR01_001002 [Friedmanniomyces endolithicus]KAK0320580.1 hypothetical protein LTR82_008293 [Friedmanniomyces endolithicus]